MLPAFAAGTAHLEPSMSSVGEMDFFVDANAFNGQKAEVTAFYRATGNVCVLRDGETDALLYNPSSP